MYVYTQTAALSVCDAVKLGAIPRLTHLGLAYNWIGVLGSRAVGKCLLSQGIYKS